MLVIPSLFLVFAAYAVHVDSFPQNDMGFPEGLEGVDEGLGNRQGFRPRQSFIPRPPGDNFGSPGFPGNNFNSGRPNSGQPINSFRPQSSQSGNNFGSSGLRPGNDFGTSNSRPGNNVRPSTNTRPVNNQRPNSNSQNANGSGSSGSQGGNTRPSQGQTTNQPTSTTSTTGETTTRIPPRDPTNRIVYTVSCDCQYTRQYAPVCGTDGQTYGNLGVLECANQCGSDVRIYLMGACGRNNG